jgi:hypothetical protein
MQANINRNYLLFAYVDAVSKKHYLHMRIEIANLGYI